MKNYIIKYTDKYDNRMKVCIFHGFKDIVEINSHWMDLDIGRAYQCIEDKFIMEVHHVS